MENRFSIVKITQKGGRYQATIVGVDEVISLTQELVDKHRLKVGIVLTEAQVEQLKAEAELAACDQEVARLLSMRQHSVGEARIKLQRKKFSGPCIDKVVKKYVKQQLLDDAHYAQMLVRQVQERTPAGRAYLIACLQRKQIDRQLAEETVNIFLQGCDEAELAVAALEKRLWQYRQFDLETARRKAYNYLSRRGIGYEAAKAAVARLVDAREEGDNS